MRRRRHPDLVRRVRRYTDPYAYDPERWDHAAWLLWAERRVRR